MPYDIDRRIFWLYETVEMLYKYCNGISFRDIAESMFQLYGASYPGECTRRLMMLETVSQEVCAGVDPTDGPMQTYFHRFETDALRDNMCLAKALTLSFFLYDDPDPQQEVSQLKARWAQMRCSGFRLGDVSMSGLEFRAPEPQQQERELVDLFYRLNYPAEYRMELLRAFSHYDESLDELLELVLPYAHRLRQRLEREPWMMEETANYWQQQFDAGTSPSALVNRIAQGGENLPNVPENRVLLSLMSCTATLYDLPGEYSAVYHGKSTFVIGCAVTIHSTIRKMGGSAERTCAILRSISDKSKFAVLQRLGQERSYGQKLAEEMNINPGHMSRILMTLWGYGFLTREQEQGRYYYTTNKDSLHDFLRRAEQLLLGGKNFPAGGNGT